MHETMPEAMPEAMPETRPEARRAARRMAFFGGSFDPPHRGHLAVARAALVALDLDTVLFAPVGLQPLKTYGATASFEDRVAMTRLAIAGQPGFDLSLADAPKPSGGPNFTFETLARLRAGLGPDGALFCLLGADSFFSLKHWHRAAVIPFIASFIVASRPGQRLGQTTAVLQAALPPGLTLEPAPELLPPPNKSASGLAASGLTESSLSKSSVEVRAFSLMNPAGNRAPFYLLPGLKVEISASQIRDTIHDTDTIDASASVRPSAAPEVPAPADALLPHAVAEYIRSHSLYR